ncbi:unnamed protein product [Ectocarpus sp. 6 AP-2014]
MVQPREIFKACDVRGEVCAGVVAVFRACRQHVKTGCLMEPHIAAALELDGLASQHMRRTVQTIQSIMDTSKTCLRMFGMDYMLVGLEHILSNVYLSLRTSCFTPKQEPTDYFVRRSVHFLRETYRGGTGEAFLSTLHCEPSFIPGPPLPRRVRPGCAENQLHRAARNGLAPKTAMLLKRGISVEAIDGSGYTPLVLAVYYQHISVIRVLLEGGADVNASNGGQTAMMVSVESGNVAITNILVQAGADVNARGIGWNSPLKVAVRANNYAMVSLLVLTGADMNMPYESGATPLLLAVGYGYMDIVTLFIDAGANVNVRGKGGRTSLIEAANNGDGRAITALVSAGADPTLGYTDSRDGLVLPLDFLTTKGHVGALNDLMRVCNGIRGCGGVLAGVNALLSGVGHSSLDAVRALATWGVTDYGMGLMIAIGNADLPCVKMLTSLFEERRHSMPPGYLNTAVSCGHLDLCGVAPRYDFDTPLTPLALAVMQNHKYSSVRIVRHLIDSGSFVVTPNTVTSPLPVVEVLLRGDTLTDDCSRARLALIGRLLDQSDAIRAGSWHWPVCSSEEGDVSKSKKKVNEGFRTMLQGMKRRVGTYQFVPRVRISMV